MTRPTPKERREMHVGEEVRKILDMFENLRRCYEALPSNSGINPKFVKFDGFDGNNELEYLRAAESMLDFEPTAGAYDSHLRMLPWYQTLLQRWRESRDMKNLTRDDLIRITAPLNAGQHYDPPSTRS